jgi:hypothetical protein
VELLTGPRNRFGQADDVEKLGTAETRDLDRAHDGEAMALVAQRSAQESVAPARRRRSGSFACATKVAREHTW